MIGDAHGEIPFHAKCDQGFRGNPNLSAARGNLANRTSGRSDAGTYRGSLASTGNGSNNCAERSPAPDELACSAVRTNAVASVPGFDTLGRGINSVAPIIDDNGFQIQNQVLVMRHSNDQFDARTTGDRKLTIAAEDILVDNPCKDPPIGPLGPDGFIGTDRQGHSPFNPGGGVHWTADCGRSLKFGAATAIHPDAVALAAPSVALDAPNIAELPPESRVATGGIDRAKSTLPVGRARKYQIPITLGNHCAQKRDEQKSYKSDGFS